MDSVFRKNQLLQKESLHYCIFINERVQFMARARSVVYVKIIVKFKASLLFVGN